MPFTFRAVAGSCMVGHCPVEAQSVLSVLHLWLFSSSCVPLICRARTRTHHFRQFSSVKTPDFGPRGV